MGEGGQLYKLSPLQLNAESRERIDVIEAKRNTRLSRGEKLSVLVSDDVDASSEELIVRLASWKIPNIRFESASVESVVDQLLDNQDPAIRYYMSDDSLKSRQVSIELRNLHMDEMLSFILQQCGMYYVIREGTIEIMGQ